MDTATKHEILDRSTRYVLVKSYSERTYQTFAASCLEFRQAGSYMYNVKKLASSTGPLLGPRDETTKM